jgi:hypothetical protein
VVVDCTDDPGVAFVVTDGAGIGTMDVRRLVGDEAHDVPVFLVLVPDLPHQGAPGARAVREGHTDPGSGLALGLSVHHGNAGQLREAIHVPMSDPGK